MHFPGGRDTIAKEGEDHPASSPFFLRRAVPLAAAAPVGSNVAIFAQIYGANYRDAVKDVCLSTLASIITMPVIIAAANLLW